MNQKELNELRRRFRLDRSSIHRVFGCYVNNTGEIVTEIDASLGVMPPEEGEMYLNLLKKSLSGTLGKNLLDVEFTTQQVVDSEEHRLLSALYHSRLEDAEARQALYRKIIAGINMEESAYVILLGADAYDVPYRGRDDSDQADAGDQVFSYFVCSICPIKDPKLALRYFSDSGEFHTGSTGQLVSAPELGFLFPCFDNRAANIYNALYYCRSADKIHPEFLESVFHTKPLLSAAEQKEAFSAALEDSLHQECNFDVVQAVHEQLCERLESHKQSKDPEPPALSSRELQHMLRSSGVPEEKAEAFAAAVEEQFGTDTALHPGNLMDSKKFEITTPEVRISVAPEYSCYIETRIINGRKFILVPADESVLVNGIPVYIEPEE